MIYTAYPHQRTPNAYDAYNTMPSSQGNSYDCCHRFYGAPQYAMLIEPDETSYRAVDKYLFADTSEILANTVIVDKEVNRE